MSKGYVLITGATSGIGAAISEIFIKQGYPVLLTGRNVEKLEEFKKRFSSNVVETIAVDLNKIENINVLREYIKKHNIYIEILINNAGAGYNGYFLDIPVEKHKEIINLNVTAFTEILYLSLDNMMKNGGGKVLNVASSGAYQPGPTIGVYYATKAYVLSLSTALREEYKDKNISISTLCPGATKTAFSKRAGKGDLANAVSPEFVAKKAVKGLFKGQAIIKPGMLNRVLINITKVMPATLNAKIVKKIQTRAAKKI